MIFYYSGLGYKPEKLFKGKCSLMMSFILSAKKPTKRFLDLYKKRRKK